MKLRTSALVISAILLCAAALALTAQDIDNCCFVDRQCSSDQEWTDGYQAFQDNQCPVPGQTVAPAPSQPTGGAPAQIDNCCFVDRQCHSEQDWINGWQAYQHGQCHAPAQSAVSSQRASGVIARTANWVVIGYPGMHDILPSTTYFVRFAPGERRALDNCCQMNWQCNSEQDWAKGYSTFLQNVPGATAHCALPGLISILGDPVFVDHYERALEALKTRAPQLYDYVLNGLDKIEQRTDTGNSNVATSNRAFYVGWRGVGPADVGRLDAVYAAAELVHEAVHVHRNEAGLDAGELEEERVALSKQIAALEVMSPGHSSLSYMRHLLANIDNPEYQWWHY
ncbi:MAG: hypothetical protein OXN94_16660 [Chloroflexota bacterium]|nr:hypothetical protein [Chloroflexota bacterium]MDE2859479.1 hypothetical protein [Chloroflexota bacterium]